MLMERERRNGINTIEQYSYDTNGHYSHFCNDYSLLEKDKIQNLPSSTIPSAGFIEHPVSRFDTLAGVAIKYGVEVADIKRMNGLVTDLQMFALKTLQIPLPGRHPPSPCLSNDSTTPGQSSANESPAKNLSVDWLDSFQSLRLKSPRRVSPAMSSLQGYYGLKPTEKKTMPEGFEMALYRKGEADYLEDGLFLKPSSSNPLSMLKRKSRSVANGFYDENGEILVDIMSAGEGKEGEPDNKSNEKLIRRRQKSEADFTARLLKEDNTGNVGFPAITAKQLALRSKAGSRMNSAAVDGFNVATMILGEECTVNGYGEVRKSSSTSCLHDHQENSSNIGSSSLSSLWPAASKWSLKPDLQALSTAGIKRPILDGFTKPMPARKNKAALD
ncbi:uncharacterized protein LOC105782419 isoform X2 [Gossypium raimondii]|uniref:LysM domain-containing protein n=1 Tax=Gossypium raimondii TaxID=29730 RepID=A0A0D2VBQ8_GOSRA|nr:uncharacterized protein LOC105782419 isoform X2 [Gossypium raimondii]KJB79869.1 hypothetical protein B456_013G070300 [Gossypium raimondii]